MRLALLLSLLLLSPLLYGQQIELEHVPEGQIIEHEGVTYMAYDLETFRAVAGVDLELQACLIDLQEAQESAQLYSDYAASVASLAEQSRQQHAEVLRTVEGWAPVPESSSWFSWEHTPFELAILTGWAATFAWAVGR